MNTFNVQVIEGLDGHWHVMTVDADTNQMINHLLDTKSYKAALELAEDVWADTEGQLEVYSSNGELI